MVYRPKWSNNTLIQLILKLGRENPKKIMTCFSRPLPNHTKCMFSESACHKTNFGTYLEFLVLAVAEKFLGNVSQFRVFFTFPAIHAPTKLFITFDRLNQFFRIIACFKGHHRNFKKIRLEIREKFHFEIWPNFDHLKNF